MSDDVIENGGAASKDAAADVDGRSDIERERDEYLETLQRLQAEFENYRKRVARSSEEAAVRGAGAIVVTLLPVLDAFDLALAHFEGSETDE
ncbi:MAG: nucleotide exchange factor GrpE, partial [Acidimicrobiales bacterium]